MSREPPIDGDRNTPSSGRSIARNTLINLVGYVLPSTAALLAIPQILNGLGLERFGLLVLAWAVVGYMGIFDLGLGQSLTRNLAKAFAEKDPSRAGNIVGSAIVVLGVLGIVAGILAYFVVPHALGAVVEVDPTLLGDATLSFSLLALVIPAAVIAPGLMGILEARNRFDLSNAVSVPMGIFNFVGPLIAVQFSNTLAVTVAVLAAGRVVGLIAVAVLVTRYGVPPQQWRATRSEAKELLTFGGWVTASRIIVPLIGYFDRFAIAALLPIKALSYYGPPVEIASRLSIIPTAIAKALLPAMSSRSGSAHHDELISMYWTGVKFSLLLMFPAVLVISGLAGPILMFWLGPEAAEFGTSVFQFYLIYAFVSSVGYPASTLLLSVGKPRISALIQIAELPLYAAAIWLAVPHFGIAGAAAIAAFRCSVDGVAHFYFARRAMGGLGEQSLSVSACIVGAFAFLTIPVFWGQLTPWAVALGLIAEVVAAWTLILTPKDKAWLGTIGIPALGGKAR